MRGIVTVLNTPFAADDTVDLEALRRNVEIALEAGVAGFLVPAMAAEVGKLTADERLAMVRATIDAVNGRVPVIGGASAPDATSRESAARALIDAGCSGVLASLPYVDDADYERHVRALADMRPGFLMLQDWDFNGYGLPVPLIVRLFETIEAFAAIKIEVVPAGVKYSEVLAATGGELHVSGGWAVMQMIEAFDRGVHAVMPTAMHGIYTDIYRRYASGDRQSAKELFNRLLPVLAFSNQHLDISIRFFKRLLWRQGVYPTDRVRPPILPFDATHAQIADELIDLVNELTP
ncbi:MAG: dihydrodipicolinate synthase family protein [Chloroflexi bacterium]|nr:dihydrodipicolinate synthase family protein [Chloroflexota bacterium]